MKSEKEYLDGIFAREESFQKQRVNQIKAKKVKISVISAVSVFLVIALVTYYTTVYMSVSNVNVQGNYMTYRTIDELDKAADLIIIGSPTVDFEDRIHEVKYFPDGVIQDYYTLTDITIEKIIKEPNDSSIKQGNTIQIVEPIGLVQSIIGKQKMKIEGYDEMLKDNRYIIFLKKNSNGVYSIINMNSGKFNMTADNEDQIIDRNMVLNKYYNQKVVPGTINEDDVVIRNIGSASIAVNYSDPSILREEADHIIIGKVTNIFGGTNYNPALKVFTSIFTVGEIEVLETFKGNLVTNKVIPFVRLGGVISIKEYEKGVIDLKEIQQIDKFTSEEKEIKYVSSVFEDDIQIEEEKTYLMYLNYDSDNDRYVFKGMQYGLREFDISTRKIMNNDSHIWEEFGNP